MPTEVIGMYGAISGTGDAIAQVDVPQDGVIVGVDWDVQSNMDADLETTAIELSFIATNLMTTNDVRGRISSVSSGMSLTTSGVAVGQIQKFIGPMDIPVAGGERLYLHSFSSAGVVGDARCNVHLDIRGSSSRRSARRR